MIGLKSRFFLTNRFHVALRLFSNRSQMTSKCDFCSFFPQFAKKVTAKKVLQKFPLQTVTP